MFARVAWRSFSSTSIFSVVSFAFATYSTKPTIQKQLLHYEQSPRRGDTRRTAFASNVSIALICALTSYVTGLNSLRSFSASSTIALFFSTER